MHHEALTVLYRAICEDRFRDAQFFPRSPNWYYCVRGKGTPNVRWLQCTVSVKCCCKTAQFLSASHSCKTHKTSEREKEERGSKPNCTLLSLFLLSSSPLLPFNRFFDLFFPLPNDDHCCHDQRYYCLRVSRSLHL